MVLSKCIHLSSSIKAFRLLRFSSRFKKHNQHPISQHQYPNNLPACIKSLEMTLLFLLALGAVPGVFSFPFMASMPGVRSTSDAEALHSKRQANCPFNTNHVPGAPITAQFPYAGAINGFPSTRPGNFQVPANGDTAHQFVPPGPNDIRGPCPGLNTAANLNVGPTKSGLALCANLILVHRPRWYH